jgi:hypothetical protein
VYHHEVLREKAVGAEVSEQQEGSTYNGCDADAQAVEAVCKVYSVRSAGEHEDSVGDKQQPNVGIEALEEGYLEVIITAPGAIEHSLFQVAVFYTEGLGGAEIVEICAHDEPDHHLADDLLAGRQAVGVFLGYLEVIIQKAHGAVAEGHQDE